VVSIYNDSLTNGNRKEGRGEPGKTSYTGTAASEVGKRRKAYRIYPSYLSAALSGKIGPIKSKKSDQEVASSGGEKGGVRSGHFPTDQ